MDEKERLTPSVKRFQVEHGAQCDWCGPRPVNINIVNLRFYFAEKFQPETEKLGSFTGLEPEFSVWFGNAGFRMLLFLHPTEKKKRCDYSE